MSAMCSELGCHGCCGSWNRRAFLKTCGVGAAAVAAGGLHPFPTRAAEPASRDRVRVAAVFLTSMNTNEIWPYPGYPTAARQEQVMASLRAGCPEIEFVSITIDKPTDLTPVEAVREQVDGLLVYVMTLDWAQSGTVVALSRFAKPTVVVDEFLGGCGAFLTACSGLLTQGVPIACVSTTRLDDVVLVAREFEKLGDANLTPTRFAEQCELAYRTTFPPRSTEKCIPDDVRLTNIGKCVEQFQKSRFLIVGAGNAGQEASFLGATAHYAEFDELQALYDQASPDAASEWAERWKKKAVPLVAAKYVEPSSPESDVLPKAARVYLATLELAKKYRTDSVTMNCLGGFAAGKLPSYPCLGFMQMLDDGGQGVCEAMPDDTVSMMMARILTGRPGFVSDPALDTSRNQIVYAHCVGTTKVFGSDGPTNDYRIRTLHNRDPRGACAESLLPAGYMTTSFRTNVATKQMVIHQARSLGSLDSEQGCRTKLIGEVHGDIEKLFTQWHQFSWHRVTVYGDVKEPLAEFGRALGLQVVEEA